MSAVWKNPGRDRPYASGGATETGGGGPPGWFRSSPSGGSFRLHPGACSRFGVRGYCGPGSRVHLLAPASHRPMVGVLSARRALRVSGVPIVAPAAIAARASVSVIVDFQRLHERWSALQLLVASGLPPRDRGMSSSMTVSRGSRCGACGSSGCVQSAQCVSRAFTRATSCRRRCPLALWGLLLDGMGRVLCRVAWCACPGVGGCPRGRRLVRGGGCAYPRQHPGMP